ncbi:MAG: hypothetical protein WA906_12890 [Pacificimonas sp.]
MGSLVAMEVLTSFTITSLFSLKDEWSLPTAWSGAKWFLAGFGTWLIAQGFVDQNMRIVAALWAGVFMLLGFDELAGLHERAWMIVERYLLSGVLEAGSLRNHASALVVAAVAAIGGLVLAMFSWRLLVQMKARVVRIAIGLATFFVGAVLVDDVLYRFLPSEGLSTIFEEGLEFVGLSTVIWGIVRDLERHPIVVAFGRRARPQSRMTTSRDDY